MHQSDHILELARHRKAAPVASLPKQEPHWSRQPGWHRDAAGRPAVVANGGRRRWQSGNGHLESSLTGMALSTSCPRALSR